MRGSLLGELLAGVALGLGTYLGLELGEQLHDAYSPLRLWLDRLREVNP